MMEILDNFSFTVNLQWSTAASQQETSWLEDQLVPFCVGFTCSQCVCLGFLWVLPLPKNMHIRLTLIWTGNLSRAYPASRPILAVTQLLKQQRINSSHNYSPPNFLFNYYYIKKIEQDICISDVILLYWRRSCEMIGWGNEIRIQKYFCKEKTFLWT